MANNHSKAQWKFILSLVFQQQFFAQWQFIWFSINTIHVKYNFEFPRELLASIFFILWNNLIPHFDDIFDSREIALKSLIVISSLPLIKSLREKLNWAPLYLKTKSPFSPRDQVSINAVWFLCILPLHPWMNSNSFTNCIYADLLLHDGWSCSFWIFLHSLPLHCTMSPLLTRMLL